MNAYPTLHLFYVYHQNWYLKIYREIEKIILFSINFIDLLEQHLLGKFIWNITNHKSCPTIFYDLYDITILHKFFLFNHQTFAYPFLSIYVSEFTEMEFMTKLVSKKVFKEFNFGLIEIIM